MEDINVFVLYRVTSPVIIHIAVMARLCFDGVRDKTRNIKTERK